VSAVLIGAAFGFALPHVASYRSVWASVCAMSWPYALLVGTAATASMAAYWITIRAVLPWIRVRQAAAVRLGSNAVANTLPAGGALAMGVSWAMLSSWGLSAADYVLCTLVTGIWNVFALLGLPALALLVMATGSRPGAALITAAAVGMALLATMACGLGLLLRSPAFALRAGRALQRPRAVTYLPPIPLGALACLAWRHAPALISTRPHQTSQPSDSRRSQAPALTSSPP